MVLKLFNKDTVYSPNQQLDGYTVLKIIGEGRYGICYLLSKDNKQYVLKQLKRRILEKTRPKIHFEEEILNATQHECIPKFIKKIESENFFGYILEFKAGKTFEEIIFDDNYIFKTSEIHNIAIKLISILKYLHGINIVHRDLRIPNILYNKGNLYLVDFGLARWIDNKKYTVDMDFSYIGDFLLHLYYTSFETKSLIGKPWYKELNLSPKESMFLKRLMGIEKRYSNINEVEEDLLLL
jgi:Serine/threonine protein kinase